ncbi:MAG: hypothetical protein ACUVV6_02425 [Thermoplasmatota archaeon]
MDRLLIGASLLSLIGSLGLYAYAVSVGPSEIHGPVPQSAIGSYVAVTGMVREVRTAWGGALEAELLPGGEEPGVWVVLEDAASARSEAGNWLLTGARVRACGVLQQFRGRMEIRPGGSGELQLLSVSGLEVVWRESGLLNGSGVRLAGVAFFKRVWRDSLSFRILDPRNTSLELNCSSSSYRVSEERPPWSNGTLVRVTGLLRFLGDPPLPRLYLSGGAKGVEPAE